MDNYTEVQITINPECQDIVADIFFSNFDCEGVILLEAEYKNLELVKSVDNILKAYIKSFNEQKLIDVFSEKRKFLLENGFSERFLGEWKISYTPVENQDWSRKWKEKWKPEKAGERIVISPSWEDYTLKNDEVLIKLDPGSAFGTGTHPTTQLCIKALEKYLPQGAEVADIGTGSGILSICAIKLGAKSAFACDNDKEVIWVAEENANKNGVSEYIEFQHLTADKIEKQYDFIVANILHNILAEIMPDLKRIMKSDAKMSLSGILKEKQQIVLDSISKNGLVVIDTISQGDWISFVVKK